MALATLLANATCYGTCATAACGESQPSPGSCHHHKPSHEHSAGCLHRHAEFTSPEAGIATASMAAVPIHLAFSGAPVVFLLEPQILSGLNTDSPPGNCAFSAISILRI